MAGTCLLLIWGFVASYGYFLGLGMLVALFIIVTLFFTWDRWKITRIIGIIGILLWYAIILYETYVNADLKIFYIALSGYPMFSGTLLASQWDGFGGACVILGYIIFVITGVARFTAALPFMILGITYMFCWFGSKQLLKKSEKREEPTTI